MKGEKVGSEGTKGEGERRNMGREGKSRSMDKGGLLLLQRWSHCNIHAA